MWRIIITFISNSAFYQIQIMLDVCSLPEADSIWLETSTKTNKLIMFPLAVCFKKDRLSYISKYSIDISRVHTILKDKFYNFYSQVGNQYTSLMWVENICNFGQYNLGLCWDLWPQLWGLHVNFIFTYTYSATLVWSCKLYLY